MSRRRKLGVRRNNCSSADTQKEGILSHVVTRAEAGSGVQKLQEKTKYEPVFH